MKKILFSLFTAGIVWSVACNKVTVQSTTDKAPNLPSVTYDYEHISLPSGDNINVNSGITNTTLPFNEKSGKGQNVLVTNHGATLGRVLFYDKKLSLNNTVACGSCHLQSKAFSDGSALSTGFEGRITGRSSMAITNPQMSNNLFWDSRSSTIKDLSLRPVQNHIEMGMEDLDMLVTKLQKTNYYPPLFEKAFGTRTITKENISDAMSQFVASLVTKDSKFDKANTTNFSNFTNLENQGLQLFMGKALCSSCHAGTDLSAPDQPGGAYGGSSGIFGGDNGEKGTANIGLDLIYKDNGRVDGKFKIPSLRNIALTAPYMHDGRFKTLEEVIDHYTSGIKPNKDLDKKFVNANGSVKPIQLSGVEKMALIAFLQTLTDETYTHDVKYSNPFN